MMQPNVTPGGHYTGLTRDLMDHRDIPFMKRQRPKRITALPRRTNNRQYMPPILNQGNLGSCTANSASGVLDYHRIKAGLPPLFGSRLKQYYNTRVLEGTVQSDSGASIRNTIKAMNMWGMAPESMWPYDIPRFRERPPEHVYVEAEKNQVLAFYRLTPTRDELMEALAEELVIMFGFLVFRQFDELGRDGVVRMPAPGEQPLGAHSQVAVDYWTQTDGTLMCPTWNTWGEGHGDQGWAYFPESFLLNRQLCDDFWAVEVIEREEPPAPPPPAPEPEPEPPYIGPDMLAEMERRGHTPVSREDYPVNHLLMDMGYGIALAVDGAGNRFEYRYVTRLREIWVTPLGRRGD